MDVENIIQLACKKQVVLDLKQLMIIRIIMEGSGNVLLRGGG